MSEDNNELSVSSEVLSLVEKKKRQLSTKGVTWAMRDEVDVQIQIMNIKLQMRTQFLVELQKYVDIATTMDISDRMKLQKLLKSDFQIMTELDKMNEKLSTKKANRRQAKEIVQVRRQNVIMLKQANQLMADARKNGLMTTLQQEAENAQLIEDDNG